MRLLPLNLSLETGGRQEEAGLRPAEQVLDRTGAQLHSCGFCLEGCGVWGQAQGPSQQREQKPSTCSVLLDLVGQDIRHQGTSFLSLYCPEASITFLTQSPGRGYQALQISLEQGLP